MNKLKEPVYVTRPLLPDVNDLYLEIQEIIESKWITNHGQKHNLLESKLEKVLKVPNASVFNNGSIALLTALKTLDLPRGSDVITTPFTFAATPHCISWNGLKPVFCDIEADTMTINAEKIEKLITPNTSAILPVHVYGFPCDVEKIDEIAEKYGLKVIYDAAHAFSTEINGKPIGNFGDVTMFSFHATKLYNTIEGGCLTYNNNELKEKIYNLRNFGIKNEEEVVDIGINGKMNEFQASIGLLNLKLFKKEQMERLKIKNLYIEHLSGIENIRIPKMPKNVTDSCQYFPIVIEDHFPLTRDQIYDKLKKCNILTRKYFYPICSDYRPYTNLKSSSVANLPLANAVKHKVLCLPYYGDLNSEIIVEICDILKSFSKIPLKILAN
ncbi:DegT/DnrJ/EryC1/StrS family aminotransferase [Methanobacterium sp.]|uniref:DegT/DnrJ/EryC1/StrS family aminotransferase n=1 Tax=Methanobacterium sp. TaxID=2164 RepID=UPI003C70DDB0